ncbi:hypothetical protein BC832DRAFT_544256 [Gaertneriomyces semiglobifer]|nr:hypothetical protein BC832DRAFT_544256 [Gaertneriomyces semiglobifer]
MAAAYGDSLLELQQLEAVQAARVHDLERKIHVEMQLKRSAAAMAKVHTDRKSRKEADNQSLLATRNIEQLSLEVLKAVAEYRTTVERTRAAERWQFEAAFASAGEGFVPTPIPPPRLDTNPYPLNAYQQPTDPHRNSKRTTLSVMEHMDGPPPVPTKSHAQANPSNSASTLEDASYLSVGYVSFYEQELMETIQRKDHEISTLTGLLAEAEEHLRHMQHRAPPLPPRRCSASPDLTVLINEKNRLEEELGHAQKRIADLTRRHSSIQPSQSQLDSTALLALKMENIESENRSLQRRLKEVMDSVKSDVDDETKWFRQVELLEERNAELDQQLRQLSDSVEMYTSESSATRSTGDEALVIESLQARVVAVENTLLRTKESAERKRQALVTALEEFQNRLTVIEGEHESRKRDWKLKLAERDRDLEKLRDTMAEFPPEVRAELEAKLNDSESQAQVLRQQLADMQKELERLRREAIVNEETRLISTRQQVEEYEAKVKSLESELITVTDELQGARAKAEALRADLHVLRTEGATDLQRRHREEMQRMITLSTSKQSALEVEVARLKEDVDKTRAEKERAESAMEDVQAQMTRQITTWEQQREALELRLQEMMSELKLKDEHVSQSKSDLEKCEARLVELQEQQKYTVGRQEHEQQLQALEANHQLEVDRLNAELADFDEKLRVTQSERDVLLGRSKTDCAEINELRERLQTTENDYRERIAKLEADLEAIKMSVGERKESEDRKMQELVAQLEHVRIDFSDKQTELDALQSTVVGLRSELSAQDERHVAEIAGLQKLLEHTEASNAEQQRELEELHHQLGQRETQADELSSLRQQLDAMGAALTDKSQKDASEISRLQEKLLTTQEVHDREVGILIAERDRINQELSSLREQKPAASEAEVDVSQLERDLVECKEKYQEDCKRFQSMVDTSRNELETVRSERDRLVHRSLTDTAEMSSLREHIQQCTTDIATLRTELETTKATLNGTIEERDKVTHHNSELKAELTAATDRIRQIEEQLNGYRTQISTASHANKEDDESLQSLIERNMNMTIELADKQREVEHLGMLLRRETEQIRRLEEELEKKKASWW